MAALCTVNCSVDPPDYSIACKPDRLKGGITRLVVTACDLDWTQSNIELETFWDTGISNGKIKAAGRVKGGGFSNTDTTEDTDACLPPEISGTTWSLTVKDFNVELTSNTDWVFWNTLAQARPNLQVAFVTDQNYLFGFYPLTITSRKPTLPDNCENYFMREVTFAWKSLDEPKRTYVPFFASKFLPTS